MRVFVGECCWAACPDVPESLRREGQAMLSAVVSDLARCADVDAVTMPEKLSAADEANTFRRLCRSCDWTLVIAPESDGILLDRCRIVEAEGRRLLGPDSVPVALARPKLQLARHLHDRGVESPGSDLLRPGARPSLPCPP